MMSTRISGILHPEIFRFVAGRPAHLDLTTLPRPRCSIEHEAAIIWLVDPAELPYVRERVGNYFPRRRSALTRGPRRVVGYSILTADAPACPATGLWSRRQFYVLDNDRANEPSGPWRVGCPSRAVDPLTVFPGVLGHLTDRAWGEPLPRGVFDRYANAHRIGRPCACHDGGASRFFQRDYLAAASRN